MQKFLSLLSVLFVFSSHSVIFAEVREARILQPEISFPEIKRDSKVNATEEDKYEGKGALGSHRHVEAAKVEYTSGASALLIKGGQLVLEDLISTVNCPEANIRDHKRIVIDVPTFKKEGDKIIIESRKEEKEVITQVANPKGFGIRIRPTKAFTLPLPRSIEFEMSSPKSGLKIEILNQKTIQSALVENAENLFDKKYGEAFFSDNTNEKAVEAASQILEKYRATAKTRLRASLIAQASNDEVIQQLKNLFTRPTLRIASLSEKPQTFIATQEVYGWRVRLKTENETTNADLEKEFAQTKFSPPSVVLLMDAATVNQKAQGFWTIQEGLHHENYPAEGFAWDLEKHQLNYSPRIGMESAQIFKWLSQSLKTLDEKSAYVFALPVQGKIKTKFNFEKNKLELTLPLQVFENNFSGPAQSFKVAVEVEIGPKGGWQIVQNDLPKFIPKMVVECLHHGVGVPTNKTRYFGTTSSTLMALEILEAK